MKRAIAVLANFFFPGLGYLIAGHKRLLAVGWLVGVLGLTYVEQSLQTPMPRLYWTMFASVLIMNLSFAVDVYQLMGAQPAPRAAAPQPARA